MYSQAQRKLSHVTRAPAITRGPVFPVMIDRSTFCYVIPPFPLALVVVHLQVANGVEGTLDAGQCLNTITSGRPAASPTTLSLDFKFESILIDAT